MACGTDNGLLKTFYKFHFCIMLQFYNVNDTYRALYNLIRCKNTNHHYSYLQNAAENGAVRNWCGLQNPTHKAKT